MAKSRFADRTGFVFYDEDGQEVLNTTEEFPEDLAGDPPDEDVNRSDPQKGRDA